MKNVAVIMSGGRGERFWPLSTKKMPKQFLPIIDNSKTMLQLTVERIKKIVDIKDIYIVTNEIYGEIVKNQLRELDENQIILEPYSKNTAPCIGLATKLIKNKYDDANVIVLASDHAIENNEMFIDSLELALSNCGNDIVTLGIIPTRPETGYGYIKKGPKLSGEEIYKVDKFVEKPNYELAKEYFESPNYLWNSGIFIWKNSIMDDLLSKNAKLLYKSLEKIEESIGTDNYQEVLKEEYQSIDPISIDYAIMEKVKNILVIPGKFGWDDVGNWSSLERLKTKNSDNNIIEGDVVETSSKNNIIVNKSKDKIIATVGVENLIIINTEDKILIMNKEASSDVKKIIEEMKNKSYDKYL